MSINVVTVFRFFEDLISVIRMSNFRQGKHALADILPEKISDTVFAHNIMHIGAAQHDTGALGQLWNDPRDFPVFCC